MEKIKEVKDEKNTRRKVKIILGIITLIIIILLIVCSCNKTYDIKNDPKVNMVKINHTIATSDVCDEKWTKQLKSLTKKMEKESKEIKKIKTDDKDYEKKLNEFLILQNEVIRNLKEMLKQVEGNNIETQTLIDNLETSYKTYKNYHKKVIG